MSAVSDTTTDWQDQAVALRRDQKMGTNEIAAMFGKSASQVRRVLSAANTNQAMNGRDNGSIPGQTTVDDHLDEEGLREDVVDDAEDGYPNEVVPADDPEHPDTMAAFRVNAGEAVGDMPKREMDTGTVVAETRLAGTRQMALDFGENSGLAGAATITFKSEKLASGFYGLGDLIAGTFVARVTSAPGREKFDKTAEEWRTDDVAYGATLTEVALAPAMYSSASIDLGDAIRLLEAEGFPGVAAILSRLHVGGE